MADTTCTLRRGSRPLLLSVPHSGTRVPEEILRRFTAAGHAQADTDWHVDRLYDFAESMGASVLVAQLSRYVIDLNRAPDGRALYAGADNTELCPTTTFAREAIYEPGQAPGADEVEERRERWWTPYHHALQAELSRLLEAHGRVTLFDAHSIRSQVPRFFEGRLPDLNLGTAGGTSCRPELRAALSGILDGAPGFSHAVDGRFRGGYITRAYGRPAEGVDAVQLEMAQDVYMDESPPWTWRPAKAEEVRPILRALLEAASR